MQKYLKLEGVLSFYLGYIHSGHSIDRSALKYIEEEDLFLKSVERDNLYSSKTFCSLMDTIDSFRNWGGIGGCIGKPFETQACKFSPRYYDSSIWGI